MDIQTARELNEMNKRFYASQSTAFSRTRNNGWPGWQRCLETAGVPARADSLKVLDAACGNLRFEAWAKAAYPTADFAFIAVDNCRDLLPATLPKDVAFLERDLVGCLLDEKDTAPCLSGIPACDLAVSYGFMHHIPGMPARTEFLRALLSTVRLGGYVAVSFWRFADDPGLAQKARKSTQEALYQRGAQGLPRLALEDGDYLLGFDNAEGAIRYCHSFSEWDIDGLLDSLGASCTLADRFRSDGRTGALNEYVVLRR